MLIPSSLEVLDKIRSATITAVFSVDSIYNRLALKGGNALRLIYEVQDRSSLDLDFSLEGDLPDFDQVREELIRSLRDRLDSSGFSAFDEKFTPRPLKATGTWGGYKLEFKVIRAEEYRRLSGNLDDLRRQAIAFSPEHHRTWTVDISKFEFCATKKKYELNYHTIFVYTPEMIVIEKLRALCQQMPEYPHRGHPTPRARDFYDIYEVMQSLLSIDGLKIKENSELARNIFEAKLVPLPLLALIRKTNTFHAPDWPSVEQSVTGRSRPFDFYFEFVCDMAEELERFWIE
jgi:predicted nucleotidyltransferase component of viral defense system